MNAIAKVNNVHSNIQGKSLSEGKALKFYFETRVNLIMLGCFGQKAKFQ